MTCSHQNCFTDFWESWGPESSNLQLLKKSFKEICQMHKKQASFQNSFENGNEIMSSSKYPLIRSYPYFYYWFYNVSHFFLGSSISDVHDSAFVSHRFVRTFLQLSQWNGRERLTIINVLLLFLKTCRPDPEFSHFTEQQLCEISHIFLHVCNFFHHFVLSALGIYTFTPIASAHLLLPREH